MLRKSPVQRPFYLNQASEIEQGYDLIKQEVTHLFLVIKNDRVTCRAGMALIALVLTIFVFYILASLASDQSELAGRIANAIGLSSDGSLSEQINYGIAFLAASMFFLAFLENRSWNLLSLAALLAFIWFDDSAMYHERFGELLVTEFNLAAAPGLRPQDTGELVAWGIAGAALSLLFLWSYRRRIPGDLGILITVFAAFVVLVFFGIVVDLIHEMLPDSLAFMIGTLEDGGEMFAVTFITICSIGVMRNAGVYFELCAKMSIDA